MEEKILSVSKSLATFCNHLETGTEALKQSIQRRPIPLDSASSTFIQNINRRVLSASNDLDLLESMSFGTVSFEELLGHCNEVYKKNQTDLVEIEDRLKGYGYVTEFDFDGEEGDGENFTLMSTPCNLDSKLQSGTDWFDPPKTVAGSIMKDVFDEDHLFDESLSLKNLGISDACLATLASEANADNGEMYKPHSSVLGSMKNQDNKENEQVKLNKHGAAISVVIGEEGQKGSSKRVAAPKCAIHVSEEDYNGLPSYMKGLASWKDLLAAVEKINLSLEKKVNTKEANFFHQDELSSLELGSKGRTYLLLLIRMNQLVVETVDGSISYRVL